MEHIVATGYGEVISMGDIALSPGKYTPRAPTTPAKTGPFRGSVRKAMTEGGQGDYRAVVVTTESLQANFVFRNGGWWRRKTPAG